MSQIAPKHTAILATCNIKAKFFSSTNFHKNFFFAKHPISVTAALNIKVLLKDSSFRVGLDQ